MTSQSPTGRISRNEPNLQNIPIRTPEGTALKDAFIRNKWSVVRDNLMTRKGYTPYCGNPNCSLYMPRTHFNGEQFQCGCGWHSTFEPEFIRAYKTKWGL